MLESEKPILGYFFDISDNYFHFQFIVKRKNL